MHVALAVCFTLWMRDSLSLIIMNVLIMIMIMIMNVNLYSA